jgi:hypothetical protein
MKTLHHIAAVEGECVGEKREGFLLGELTSTIRSLDQKQKLVRALKWLTFTDLVKDAGPFVYQVVKNGEKSEMAVRYDAKVDVEGTVVSWYVSASSPTQTESPKNEAWSNLFVRTTGSPTLPSTRSSAASLPSFARQISCDVWPRRFQERAW